MTPRQLVRQRLTFWESQIQGLGKAEFKGSFSTDQVYNLRVTPFIEPFHSDSHARKHILYMLFLPSPSNPALICL